MEGSVPPKFSQYLTHFPLNSFHFFSYSFLYIPSPVSGCTANLRGAPMWAPILIFSLSGLLQYYSTLQAQGLPWKVGCQKLLKGWRTEQCFWKWSRCSSTYSWDHGEEGPMWQDTSEMSTLVWVTTFVTGMWGRMFSYLFVVSASGDMPSPIFVLWITTRTILCF